MTNEQKSIVDGLILEIAKDKKSKFYASTVRTLLQYHYRLAMIIVGLGVDPGSIRKAVRSSLARLIRQGKLRSERVGRLLAYSIPP